MTPDFDRLVREQLRLAPPPTDYALDCFVSSEVGYNDALRRCLPAPQSSGGTPAGAGAYLGVGPDQNFTYLGALRPPLGIVLDARLDNLLEHLVFKLAFAEAADPLDYLCLLFGRHRPAGARTAALPAPALVAQFHAQPLDPDQAATFRGRVRGAFEARWSEDPRVLGRVERLLAEFIRRQLRVTSVSESCLRNLDKIPDFEEVLTAATPEGFNLHYLTDPGRFAFVKALQAADRIVPLLGNVTDPASVDRASALAGQFGLRFGAVYLSNLEEFLLQRYVIEGERIVARPNPSGALEGEPGRAYASLVERLASLPAQDDAALIRFFFPAEHRGRQLGQFPWLESHVTFLSTFLRRYREERPATVLDTYV